MVWYLWEQKHAKIEELRRVLGESSHMNVLVRIRETINPTARKIVGRPILVFEKARIDRSSGERILHSWWLSGDSEKRPIEGERLVDIFDEGDHILVIVELVGFDEKGIQVGVEDETLVVKAEDPGRSVHEEISLPPRVDSQGFKATYRNNMLQVRFEKEQGR
jgi:HSP20 family molecular chaperone IbpA